MDTLAAEPVVALDEGEGALLETFNEVEKLAAHGIQAVDIKKLKEAGFHTIGSILMATKKTLCSVKGLSEGKVEKVCEASKKVEARGFVTGNECLEKRKQLVRITTGSSELDLLLGGGLESLSITEAFGEFRCGKTQLAHTLCVTCQLPPEHGGASGKAIYIDTENTFRPERVVKIAERFGMSPEDVLDNILVARAFTSEHQLELLSSVAAFLVENGGQYRLLVVDSLTALYRVDFSGRGELSERQQKLAQMICKLTKLSEEYNLAVYVTNQVMADPGGATFMADVKKPIGGHIVAHASTTRLFLRKGRGEQRICKIFDSPCLPEAEATFQIGDGGVTNPTD